MPAEVVTSENREAFMNERLRIVPVEAKAEPPANDAPKADVVDVVEAIEVEEHKEKPKHPINERMSDPSRRHLVLLVKRLFKFKENQDHRNKFFFLSRSPILLIA